MRCLHPLRAWSMPSTAAKPFRHLSFSPPKGVFFGANSVVPSIQVPCGKCVTCKINKKREWIIRCIFEYKALDSVGVFITLTFDDRHVSPDGVLEPSILTRFIKRLRKRIGKFRYFACGEYGTLSKRPHFHLCMFGREVSEKTLSDTWFDGFSCVSPLNGQRIAYTCGYVLKKMHPTALDGVDDDDYQPEFIRFSKGLGLSWFLRWWPEFLENNKIEVAGKVYPIPRYFILKLKDAINEGQVEFDLAKNILDRYINRLKALRQDSLGDFWETYFADVFQKKVNSAWQSTRKVVNYEGV